MSEMVERVARALYQHAGADWDAPSADKFKDHWRAAARTAIEGMRVPTDDILKAGAAKWDDDWCTETNALNMWNGMIDEALK